MEERHEIRTKDGLFWCETEDVNADECSDENRCSDGCVCNKRETYTLARDITAEELAMDYDDASYSKTDVIGKRGTTVDVSDENDDMIEVYNFSEDSFASGWIPRSAIENPALA